MSLEELIRLCPPPESPVDAFSEGRLEEIRDRYGLVLPDEYIAFGHTYGNGGFVAQDSHEIFIHNPFSRYYDKEVQDGQLIIALFFLDDAPRESLRQHRIDQASVFPLGRDTDIAHLCWVTGADPTRWRVMVLFHEWESLEVFNCGLCDFLTGHFTSQLKVQGLQYRSVNGRTQRYLFRGPE